jgi:hypothetical protein
MRFILASVIWLSFCCQSNAQNAALDKSPKGAWLSEGYGLLVELGASGLRMYQLTSMSCIAGRTGKQEKSLSSDSTTVFISGHETVTFTRTGDPNVLRLRPDGVASDIAMRVEVVYMVRRTTDAYHGASR